MFVIFASTLTQPKCCQPRRRTPREKISTNSQTLPQPPGRTNDDKVLVVHDHLANPQELDIELVKEVDVEDESDASEAIAKEREGYEQFSASRVTPRTKK